MVPREIINNGYAKFWRTNKEYYDILENGLFVYVDFFFFLAVK